MDDKDNVVAGLMMMLTLKRMNVPLDRDVIFLAESGEEGATRVGIELTATGPAGHGSVPLRGNAVVHLAAAVAKIGAYRTPITLNETTRAYFQRLATISTPAEARRYLDVISGDAAKMSAADEQLYGLEPELHRFVRFQWDVVEVLARARRVP